MSGFGAASAVAADGVAINRCVLVSKALGAAFVARPAGGIAALDLKTGAERWSSDAGALPLGLVNGALLAQGDAQAAGALELVTVSTKNGRATGRKSVALPEDVRAAVTPSPGRTFVVRASPDNSGLQLRWHAMSSPTVRGFGMPEAVSSAAQPRLSTGQIDVAMGSSGLSADAATTTAQDERVSASAVRADSTIREVTGVELSDGARGRMFASADGRNILVSERRTGAGFEDAFEWSIYEKSSGELIGKVNSPIPVAPFIVAETTLLYSTPERSFRQGTEMQSLPETLHARSLTTGATVWSHETRSLTLKGPFPH